MNDVDNGYDDDKDKTGYDDEDENDILSNGYDDDTSSQNPEQDVINVSSLDG